MDAKRVAQNIFDALGGNGVVVPRPLKSGRISGSIIPVGFNTQQFPITPSDLGQKKMWSKPRAAPK